MSPFSVLLHKLRLRSNLRQRDLATRLGYEQTYLSVLEVGRKGRPPRKFVMHLIDALSLSERDADELLDAWENSCQTIEIPAEAPQGLFEALNEIRRAMDQLRPAQIEILRQAARISGEVPQAWGEDRLRIRRSVRSPSDQSGESEMT